MDNLYDSAINNIMPDMFFACTKPEFAIDPDTMLKTFNIRDRAINIYGVITEQTAHNVIEMIRFFNAVDFGEEEPLPIQIFIDSTGGDLSATLSIIAAMKMSLTPIHTYNLGNALSGGFFIHIAGDKRFAAPYATYLFHEGSSMMGGDSHKFFQGASYYKKQLNILKDIVLDNTKISKELYNEKKKDDWWFGNDTAIKLGVTDKIMDSFSIPDLNILKEKEEEEEEGNESKNTK